MCGNNCKCENLRLPDLGILLIRLGVGIVFLVHGYQKLMALDGTIGFMGKLGVPSILVYLVVAIEFLGGIAMILGLCSRLAGILIAAVMVGAIYLVKFNAGFTGGYEFDLVLLLSALGITFLGSGKYSLEKMLGVCEFSNKTEETKTV